MQISKLTIREMKNGEQKQVASVGRRAFPFVEALFVTTPEKAMVAEYEGKIIGGIIYKNINLNEKKVIYIDEAFVDTDYHGLGVGKKLYRETFNYLRNQGCDTMTALVKDDNVGSWKLFMDNDFKRAGFFELKKEIGICGIIKHFLKTPFAFAVGMDFYIANKGNTIQGKNNSLLQIVAYLLLNILLTLPLWVSRFIRQPEKLLYSLSAYITILLLFIGSRYIGSLFNKDKWKFRLNNGGSFLTFLLSFFGNIFPMHANWYPDKYEDTTKFKRKLAIPELVKLGVFLLLPLLYFTDSMYLKTVGEISRAYLMFMIIPFYPFEAFGAGRIYNYSRKLWAIAFITVVSELIFMFNIAG